MSIRLVSADGHINEPPDLWVERLPAKFRSRAPRMERFEQGDAWVVEGVAEPINFGHNICGGMPFEQHAPWKRWEDARPGGYDPAARLALQDEDGVDAEIMYPTPRISTAGFSNNSDAEFHLAHIRAYNDWLSEFCSHAPNRLVGTAMMPTTGIRDALDELHRSMALPGMRSPLLGRWPSGEANVTPDDDPFWGAAQEMGIPISIHVGLSAQVGGDGDPNRTRPGARGELRHVDAPLRCLEMIQAGVFDRFPDLNVVFAEVDCSWVPYVKEQFDDRFGRRSLAARPNIKNAPSAYFERNLFFTYITDRYGVINRHHVGITQMMWSSDFPHTGTDWPASWKTIEKDFEGVPEDEKHAILAGNAMRVYRMTDGE